MKLQFLSDLHIDHHPVPVTIIPHAPYLALIGDIAEVGSGLLPNFLGSLRGKFQRVFYVPGNHEYYRNELEPTHKVLEDICEKAGVELLQKKTVEVEGVLVSGCTLWSHPTEEGFHKRNADWILNFGRERMIEEHLDHLAFLKRAITGEKPHVVLTHYAPLMEMNGEWLGDVNNSMFATDLSDMFRPPVRYWCCGHVHQNLTVVQNGIPCRTNCLGDPEEIEVGGSFCGDACVEIVCS